MAWRRILTDGFENGLPVYTTNLQNSGLNGEKNGSIYNLYAVSNPLQTLNMGASPGLGRNGGYACVVSASGDSRYIRSHYFRFNLDAACRNLSLRIYAFVPSGNVNPIRLLTFSNGFIKLTPLDNTITLVWKSPAVSITTMPFVYLSCWVCVEAKVKVDGANSLLALRVNGNDIGTSGVDLGSDGITHIDYGLVENTTPATVYLDDIAINAGDLADDVPWCGLCTGIVRALPKADSETMNGWTPSTGSDACSILDDVPQKWSGTPSYISTKVSGARHAVKLETRTDLGLPENSTLKAASMFATAQDAFGSNAGLKPLSAKTDAAEPTVYDSWDAGGAPQINVPGSTNYTGMMKNLNTQDELTWEEFDKLLIGVESVLPESAV